MHLLHVSAPLDKCFPVEAILESSYFTTPVLQQPNVSLRRKVGTELIGTFVLMFAATATPIVNEKTGGSVTLLGNAVTAGLAAMIVIFATGHVSGAHVNPAITIAFASLRHFPWVQVPFYIAAQVLGSIAAPFALKGIFDPYMHGGVTLPQGDDWPSFVLEFIISFNLMFVITAVATDARPVSRDSLPHPKILVPAAISAALNLPASESAKNSCTADDEPPFISKVNLQTLTDLSPNDTCTFLNAIAKHFTLF